MDRTTKILSAGVIAGFVLLALLPFIGVHPVSVANKVATLWQNETGEITASSTARIELASLDSGDPELIKAAIYALSNSLTDEEVSLLFPFVEGDYTAEIQKAALYAIGNHETDEVRAFLTNIALTHQDVELSKAAVYAISNTGGENAVTSLIKILSADIKTDIRKAAVHALGNVDSDSARDALIELIQKQ